MKLMLMVACAMLPGSVALGQVSETAKVEWVTLGTSGGPAVQVERAQIANALVVGKDVYLFDVGNGVRRQMAKAGLSENNIKAVFLSHHHVDHNADVGPLLVSRWIFNDKALPIVGPEGTVALVNGLVQANAPTILASFPTAGGAKLPLKDMVRPKDLPVPMDVPTLVYQDENVKVEAIDVPHYQVPPSVKLERMPRAVAYRVTAKGRSIVYSGDTGPTDRLAKLGKGADLLVTEVVEPGSIADEITHMMNAGPDVRRSIIGGMQKNHLTPAEIGKIASQAKVKEIVLTHFVPSPETAASKDLFVRDIRASFSGTVVMANDLDRY